MPLSVLLGYILTLDSVAVKSVSINKADIRLNVKKTFQMKVT